MINTITIDTETMDVIPTAVILSTGAFAFDVYDTDDTQAEILHVSRNSELADYSLRAFYGLVDVFDQLIMCRTVSQETQNWWRRQGEDAHEALIGERHSLGVHLHNLSNWIAQHRGAGIFFRGTDFDGSILENAYRMCGMELPWRYNGKRDVRTFIYATAGTESGYLHDHQPCFQMTAHNALHDAMNDAEQMCVAYQHNNLAINS